MKPLTLYISHAISDHFRGATKMIDLGCWAKPEIDDLMFPLHNDKP